MASAWARKDFGRRLNLQTLSEAKEAIADWMAVLLVEEPQPPPPVVAAPAAVVVQPDPVTHPEAPETRGHNTAGGGVAHTRR